MNDYLYIFLAVTGAVFWTALPFYLLKRLAERFWDDEIPNEIERKLFL